MKQQQIISAITTTANCAFICCCTLTAITFIAQRLSVGRLYVHKSVCKCIAICFQLVLWLRMNDWVDTGFLLGLRIIKTEQNPENCSANGLCQLLPNLSTINEHSLGLDPLTTGFCGNISDMTNAIKFMSNRMTIGKNPLKCIKANIWAFRQSIATTTTAYEYTDLKFRLTDLTRYHSST